MCKDKYDTIVAFNCTDPEEHFLIFYLIYLIWIVWTVNSTQDVDSDPVMANDWVVIKNVKRGLPSLSLLV